VGQRQGIGVALGEPRYVLSTDPATNTVRLGRREDLETRRFEVGQMRFVAGRPPESGGAFRASVQIRHRGHVAPAVVSPVPGGDDRWAVELEEPLWAAAPGQAAVFYDADEVIGGGRIARPR
jgi:tRNA-specific 2-thiouridylase